MTEEQASSLRERILGGSWVVARPVGDAFEQAVIDQALGQEGIDHEIRLSFEHTFAFLFEPEHGYGVVCVPAGDLGRARELMAAVLAEDAAAAAEAAQLAEDSVADEESPAG